MKKNLLMLMIIGCICIISGVGMFFISSVPQYVSYIFFGIAFGSFSSWYITRKHSRGEVFVFDEISKRIVVLSGWYTCAITLYSIAGLLVINHFYPIQISNGSLLLSMWLFMILSLAFFRYILSKWGKAE
jgi:hypothetical protein